MKTRTLGRTGIAVSEIGLGCEHLVKKSESEIRAIVDAAIEHGMNIFDVFMPEPDVRSRIGKALAGRRKNVLLQGHIGSTFQDGQYKKDPDLAQCKIGIGDFLKRYQTDYIDIGMLHFMDSDEDYARYFERGPLEYALDLKKRGVIRALGMSSHNARIAKRAVGTGLIDVLMFSINPLFDSTDAEADIFSFFEPGKSPGITSVDAERASLYALCEEKGTAITVMKALAAGMLLNKDNPFGAMTVAQCEHYALNRPAVASVLIGCSDPEQVRIAAAYEEAPDKDYAFLGKTTAFSAAGRCMYCNHCLPCPSAIDIAAVTKYLDMARGSDASGVSPTIAAHYDALSAHASDCVECGSCEEACPFGVQVIENMREAAKLLRK